jgi:hypothetical protein
MLYAKKRSSFSPNGAYFEQWQYIRWQRTSERARHDHIEKSDW